MFIELTSASTSLTEKLLINTDLIIHVRDAPENSSTAVSVQRGGDHTVYFVAEPYDQVRSMLHLNKLLVR